MLFPPHTSEFTLQILDLTHICFDSNSDVIVPDDMLALAAAVEMFIELHLSPQQRYARTLPNYSQQWQRYLPGSNLTMSWYSHTAHTIQQVAHVEFRMVCCGLGGHASGMSLMRPHSGHLDRVLFSLSLAFDGHSGTRTLEQEMSASS